VLGVRRVKILGCGLRVLRGQAGALLIESLSRIPADAEPASEFRYRNPVIDPETLYVAVSQSGETFDTLAAIREVKRKGGDVIGVVNATGSTVAGECGSGVYIHAGPEVSVTSTKSYTSTVVAFALLALQLGRVRDLGPGDGSRLISAWPPCRTDRHGAGGEDTMARWPDLVAPAAGMFFVGRVGATQAEERAEAQEVSYVPRPIPAELKHGPLALVRPDVPTVVVPRRRPAGQEPGHGGRNPRPAQPGDRADPRRAGGGRAVRRRAAVPRGEPGWRRCSWASRCNCWRTTPP
jgi:glucosamine--fructose-6-phosphate aminotransferase (isomerizing)